MIKIIHKINPDAFEKEVNSFIEANNINVISVQYSTELHHLRSVNGFSNVTNTECVTEHYAMIVYDKIN